MYKLTIHFIIALLLSNIIYATQTFVFVGSYNVDKTKEGIYVFELDTLTGSLTKVSSVKDILNPSFFTLSQNGSYLFSCTDTRTAKAGSVSSFSFDATTKKLSFINSQKTNGENPVYIALHKNETWLLNANYNDGSVSVYPVNKNGSISPVTQFINYTDSSINKKRQTSSHIHATVFSPDNKFVFLPDLGADKIRCYAFDNLQTKPLQSTKFPFTKTTAGCGPRHLTFHPERKFAYCIEELSGTISMYSYENGRLKNKQRIKTIATDTSEVYSSADIHISPDGKFLYASNRGEENNIAIFSIQKNGKLKLAGFQTTFGKTPRNFCIDETGKFLIVANQTSGNIIVFNRNVKTGLLKKVHEEINVPGASCVRVKMY